jgi:hypothetical protein
MGNLDENGDTKNTLGFKEIGLRPTLYFRDGGGGGGDDDDDDDVISILVFAYYIRAVFSLLSLDIFHHTYIFE